MTLHRQENVDDKKRFSSILKGLELVGDFYGVPVVYPVHPRAQKMMKSFGLDPMLMLVNPFDFFTFLQLERSASLVFTDSGGVQEEACILGVPCVTLRDNTERQKTIGVGSNVLAGTSPKRMLECSELMLGRENSWSNPFGDGKAAKRIVRIIMEGKHG